MVFTAKAARANNLTRSAVKRMKFSTLAYHWAAVESAIP